MDPEILLLVGGGLLVLAGMGKSGTGKGKDPKVTNADRVLAAGLQGGDSQLSVKASGSTAAPNTDMVTGQTAVKVAVGVASIVGTTLVTYTVTHLAVVLAAVGSFLATYWPVVVVALIIVAVMVSVHFASRAFEWNNWYAGNINDRYLAALRASMTRFADAYLRSVAAGLDCPGNPKLSFPPTPNVSFTYNDGKSYTITATNVGGYYKLGGFGDLQTTIGSWPVWYDAVQYKKLTVTGLPPAQSVAAFTLGLFFAIEEQWAYNNVLRKFYSEVRNGFLGGDFSEAQQYKSNISMPGDVFWAYVQNALQNPMIVGPDWNNGAAFQFNSYNDVESAVLQLAPHLFNSIADNAHAMGNIQALSRVVQEHTNNDWFIFWPGDLAYQQTIQAHTTEDWPLAVAADWQGVNRGVLRDPRTGAEFFILNSRDAGGPVFKMPNIDYCKVG